MSDHADTLADVLAELQVGLAQLRGVLAQTDERADELAAALSGHSLISQIILDEAEPRLVQLLSESLELVQQQGTRVRRTQAQLLYAEGLSMDEIAGLFGVTRQRIGTLLRAKVRGGYHDESLR